MSELVLFGVTGVAFSGKTTFCNAVTGMFPYGWDVELVGFADAVKQECATATGLIYQIFNTKDKALKDTLRPLLQWWGTEFRRNTALGGDPDYWVRRAEERIQGLDPDANRVVAFHDVRFPNEAEMIRRRGGLIVRIDGLNCYTTSTAHSSETPLPPELVDVVITNDHYNGMGCMKDIARKFFDTHYREFRY